MTALNLFGEGGRTDAPEVLEAGQVDYTPIAVALQLTIVLLELRPIVVRRAMDGAAGSGAWGRVLRALCPDAHLIGIDNRATEARNLQAAYNTALVADTEALPKWDFSVDLFATNPPFRAFGCKPKGAKVRGPFWPGEIIRPRGWLKPDGVVALYGLSQWGQAAEHQEFHRLWCPSMQIRVGGRIAHRGSGAGDQREYSLWIWDMADRRPPRRRPTWDTVQLEPLPDTLRSWSPGSVPGTYAVAPELVAEVRKYI